MVIVQGAVAKADLFLELPSPGICLRRCSLRLCQLSDVCLFIFYPTCLATLEWEVFRLSSPRHCRNTSAGVWPSLFIQSHSPRGASACAAGGRASLALAPLPLETSLSSLSAAADGILDLSQERTRSFLVTHVHTQSGAMETGHVLLGKADKH